MTKLSKYITIVLLLLAILIEWVVHQKNANHSIAEKYIGKCNPIDFQGADAFQSSSKTVVFFKSKGFQGPIEAFFIISNNEIEKLQILKANEGLNKSALNSPQFLKSFEQNILDLPINVDAVSGATISSQIIIDDMNRYLKQWNKEND